MANLAGQLISNRYLVRSLVAEGGMASVYLAQDQVLDREVALKAIHPHLARDKSFVDKFRREAKVAAKLSHPNLVNVFDQGNDGDVIFLVMEYVPGITLRDAMNDFGALDSKKTLEIIEPLTAALAAAHASGILHRDLKPENVFLSDSGKVKLGDFGLARAITQQTQTGSVVGTVAYLSPELILRGQADARSDVYSLGVMIFEMLTGSQPFKGEQAVQIAYQHANKNVPSPSSINNAVPELLDEIVLWATARNPAHRPASAQVLLPVIQRAGVDLARGLDTSLQQIDKTARINFDEEFVVPEGGTEIITVEDIEAQQFESEQATKLKKANKRSKFWLAIFTMLAIFGGAGSGWWFSSGPGGLSVVPELSGRTAEAAVAALESLELTTELSEEYSTTVSKGKVSRTDPASGSRVFKNSTVTIYVSLGPKQIKVPDPQGLSVQDATALLSDTGFVLGGVRNFFSDAPAGQVFELSEQVGTILDEGSVVDIHVSLGPVPQVLGLTADQARVLLVNSKLIVIEIEVFSNDIPAGSVIGLNISESPLPEGATVTLEISKGPKIVIMPNVEGETIAAAERLLESLGLRVLIDTNQLRSNYGIAKVTSQLPRAGSEVRVGDRVTIVSR